MPEPIRLKTGCSSDAYIKWVALALDEGWMADDELTMMRVHGSNAFTRRPVEKKRLSGQLELITGIWLYDRWPLLQRLALKVFSRGLGANWPPADWNQDTSSASSRSFATLPCRSVPKCSSGRPSGVRLAVSATNTSTTGHPA